MLSSPSERATRTAELAGLRDVVVDEDLVEWDYGDYEGITTAEIRERRPQWTVWTHDLPGGETADRVTARADRVLARIRAAMGDGDVIAVGHGHFSRVMAARWIGLAGTEGQHLGLDTGTVCVLGFEHDHPAIHRWNLPVEALSAVL